MQRIHLAGLEYPLVNRESAILQVLNAFEATYPSDSKGVIQGQRPNVCYAPQMYGSGKSTFGENFQTFLLANKDSLLRYLNMNNMFPGVARGENVGERALDALLNETLYVKLNLVEVPNGTSFQTTLLKWISKKALAEFPNGSELLSQVLYCMNSSKQWLQKLLQVTQKRYLYLFIDEIGALEGFKFSKFEDLIYSYGPTPAHNIYRAFFRVLSSLLVRPFVICVVAGRSDAIITRQRDASISRVKLSFLRLDPFSEETVKFFIQNTTHHNESILKLLFPNHPEGHDWFFKQIHSYTGGVPYYVVYVLKKLCETCRIVSRSIDPSEDEIQRRIEQIPPDSSLSVRPSHRTPEAMTTFTAMLLASMLEFRIPMEETLLDTVSMGLDSKYVLDIANHFGFYYKNCSKNEHGEEIEASLNPIEQTFVKLVFPKIALKYIEIECWDVPPIRFICSLFSSISRFDSPSSRGFKFEIIFTLILYVRWCFRSRLGELSLFRHSLVEDIPIKVGRRVVGEFEKDPILKYVPALSSTVVGIHSASEETYHVSAWKPLFETCLSNDGIFIPTRQNSSGPDVLIRVTQTSDNSILIGQDASSVEQISMETETSASDILNKRRIYLIGIALKCYQMSSPGVGRSIIKAECAKFLHPVASQLDLENHNIMAIQLIVSNKYTAEVSKQLKDNQNWVLDSGIYYEDHNNHIVSSPINSATKPQNTREEWLWIPPHCQVVVCSTSSLKSFLGCKASEDLDRVFGDHPLWLDQLRPLSNLLENSLIDLLSRAPFEQSSERNIQSMERGNPVMNWNVMQVEEEDTRGEQKVAASSSLSSSFDWNTFLREYCHFTEAPLIERYAHQLRLFSPLSFPYLNDTRLSRYGIAPQDIPLIVDGIHEFLEQQSMNVDLVER
ncbi:archaeal ATPase / transposase [Galdieria sulphuraria]|uniref:Archaeal ATPase / transposase n=1 Tax=Galdieria sulphuraria TaxID=130081 RepID=M2Y2E6_GALSU|nr:archaeal ATPase / transposase [Galdieria sulphuraria]EME29984.1 archaeal ATPase / transposase [Galdieria sulphuraria]|eukprot:XP_005706504.1 archaeal ATPase / transposase [Galdieria sulphuraria]